MLQMKIHLMHGSGRMAYALLMLATVAVIAISCAQTQEDKAVQIVKDFKIPEEWGWEEESMVLSLDNAVTIDMGETVYYSYYGYDYDRELLESKKFQEIHEQLKENLELTFEDDVEELPNGRYAVVLIARSAADGPAGLTTIEFVRGTRIEVDIEKGEIVELEDIDELSSVREREK